MQQGPPVHVMRIAVMEQRSGTHGSAMSLQGRPVEHWGLQTV